MSILKVVCVLVRNLFVNRSILIAEKLALGQQLAVQQRTVRRRSRGGNSEGARPAFDPGQWSAYLRQHGIGSQHELFQPETFIRSLPAENYMEKVLVKSADEVLDLWIGTRMKAIKEQSPNHFVTVGHNKPMTLLPANQKLDFITHHKYHKAPLADSYEGLLGNVMIIWTDEEIKLMSTCDVTIAIKPIGFAPLLTPSRATVSGFHGGLEQLGERLKITLLEGEVITIQPSK